MAVAVAVAVAVAGLIKYTYFKTIKESAPRVGQAVFANSLICN